MSHKGFPQQPFDNRDSIMLICIPSNLLRLSRSFSRNDITDVLNLVWACLVACVIRCSSTLCLSNSRCVYVRQENKQHQKQFLRLCFSFFVVVVILMHIDIIIQAQANQQFFSTPSLNYGKWCTLISIVQLYFKFSIYMNMVLFYFLLVFRKILSCDLSFYDRMGVWKMILTTLWENRWPGSF